MLLKVKRKWPIHAWRGLNYNEAFPQYPDSHFKISPRWISATWIMGNNYRNPSGYYGSYPPSFLVRMQPMFPDARNILHLFSGSLSKSEVAVKGVTVHRFDRLKKLKPDICGEAENLTMWVDQQYDLIYADPPYSEEDAKKYGTCLVNKRKVMDQCLLALKPGGTLCWMDQSIPMFRKADWKWYGVISIYRSTNHRIRGVMLFQKV